MSKEGVKVRILERDFTIACAPGERSAVEAAADYLNQQLKLVQAQGKVIGVEHTVVLAALNMANELLTSKAEPAAGVDESVLDRIRALRESIAQATSA